MKTKPRINTVVALAAVLVLLAAAPVSAGTTELADLLIRKLGVNAEQAMGGTGAIFNLAKEQLSTGDFGKVAAAVPNMDELLAAAPSTGKLGGTLGGLASSLGSGSSQKVGGLSSLAGSFSQLGLSSEMIGLFTPVILSYVESKGGQNARQILEAVLK